MTAAQRISIFMDTKKVTVIIPCYNVEDYIDECLSSLEAQTMEMDDIDIICVDDCSSDRTAEKLTKWTERYPDSIKLLRQKQRCLQGEARNRALQYASGEYLCYLDADDWLVPSALEELFSLARGSGADVVGYLLKEVDRRDLSDNQTDSGMDMQLWRVNSLEDRLRLLFGNHIEICCCDKFYKRSFVLENDLRYAKGHFDEEALFTIPVCMAAKSYLFSNKVFYRYYKNPDSTSNSKVLSDEHKSDFASTWLELYDYFAQRGYLDDENYSICSYFFLRHYFMNSMIVNARRSQSFSAAEITLMQRTLKDLFPDYAQNPLLELGGVEREVLSLIERPVNDDNIDEYNAHWREIAFR